MTILLNIIFPSNKYHLILKLAKMSKIDFLNMLLNKELLSELFEYKIEFTYILYLF